MIETTATAKHFLGMSAAAFLRDFWQQKPLLIRNAFANFSSPLVLTISAASCDDYALSAADHRRSVAGSVTCSPPFTQPISPTCQIALFPLGHYVDKWDALVAALLHFDFSELARRRCLSHAEDGGSFGRMSSIDVLLIQVSASDSADQHRRMRQKHSATMSNSNACAIHADPQWVSTPATCSIRRPLATRVAEANVLPSRSACFHTVLNDHRSPFSGRAHGLKSFATRCGYHAAKCRGSMTGLEKTDNRFVLCVAAPASALFGSFITATRGARSGATHKPFGKPRSRAA